MSASVTEEARAAVASAREILRDLIEEGVHSYDRAAAAALAAAVEAEAAPAAAQAGAEQEPGCEAPDLRNDGADEAVARPDGTAPTRSHEPMPAVGAPAASGAVVFGASATLEDVRRELGDCKRCGLAAGRNKIVFGDGHPQADLMFVGEGPGQEEDRQGLPFVGRAGELLTQMIEKGLGIERSEVYICNIVKCRPPNNRTPLADEVATCSPFLDGQIAAVRPKVIVSLGKPSTSLLLGRDVAITRMRGSWHEYKGIPLMPTLHPAFVLRQYTPENRRLVWEDLKAALAKSRER